METTESKVPYTRPANTVYRQFTGIAGLVPYLNAVSASRHQMYTAQVGQTLEVSGMEPPFHRTGNELDSCYGGTTFDITMPFAGRINQIIQLYPKFGQQNPLSLVMVESMAGEHDCIEVTRFGSVHQHFGYDYIKGASASKLHAGAHVDEGEIFFQPRAKHPVTNEYMTGLNANVCYASFPGVAEDGVIISESMAKRLRFKTYEHRDIGWGTDSYPVMLYKRRNRDGVEVPCPFPDIGQPLRPDGLLMAIRSDSTLAKHDRWGANGEGDFYGLNEMAFSELTKVNHQFDKRIYAAGEGGKVIDIRVYHTPRSVPSLTPVGFDEQVQEYYDAHVKAMTQVYDYYSSAMRSRGIAAIQPQLLQKAGEAINVIDLMNFKHGKRLEPRVRRTYKAEPLDAWRVEFVVEYERDAYPGCKISDLIGGKGVIVAIWPDANMPVDAAGNRAEVMMCGDATINRMNPARFYEQFVNGTTRDVIKRVINNLVAAGLDLNNNDHERQLRDLDQGTGVVAKQWEMLASCYAIVSDKGKQWVTTCNIDYYKHIAYLLKHKFIKHADGLPEVLPADVYVAHDDQRILEQMVDELYTNFPLTMTPVTYITPEGKTFTTEESVIIAKVYLIFLEKIADSGTAISSPKLQHHGFLSKIPTSERYGTPFREQAIRLTGEAEMRIIAMCCGREAAAEMMDRNTNHATFDEIFRQLLTARTPSKIDRIIDRKRIPYGGSRSLQLLKHIAETGGYRFVYQPMWQWYRQPAINQ